MSKKSDKKSSSILKLIFKILLAIVIILIICLGAVYFFISNKFNKVEQVHIEKEELGISEEIEEKLSGFTNIAIFGLDSRKDDYGTGNRSDCIIIASINNDTKEVKLFSVYRDTYVNIDKYGLDKITHAYSYGGAALALNTINKNFDLNISEFITVNFDSVSEVVDQLGGVEIEVDASEVKYINGYISETSKVVGKTSEKITTPGVYNLNGVQAVSYSRIRYTEGGDYKRAERMREVIIAIAEKAKTKKLVELNKVVDILLPQVSSNITSEFIIKMIPYLMDYKVTSSIGWPYDTRGITLDRWYGIPVTLESNVTRLHQEIFGEVDYVPSETVKSISNSIVNKTGYRNN